MAVRCDPRHLGLPNDLGPAMWPHRVFGSGISEAPRSVRCRSLELPIQLMFSGDPGQRI